MHNYKLKYKSPFDLTILHHHLCALIKSHNVREKSAATPERTHQIFTIHNKTVTVTADRNNQTGRKTSHTVPMMQN